jgi:hypothetical protein
MAALSGALVGILAGCATPYAKNGFSGGYSDVKLAPDVATVSIQGNGYTSNDRALRMLMLRCAEVTLENRYRYFSAESWFDQSSNSQVVVPGYANTSIGNGYASTVFMPATSFNMYKPGAGVTIHMGSDPAKLSATGHRVLDAVYVQASMRNALNLK